MYSAVISNHDRNHFVYRYFFCPSSSIYHPLLFINRSMNSRLWLFRLRVGLCSGGVSSTSVTVIGSTTSGIVGISSTGISGYITAYLIVGRLICCSSSSICIRGNGIFIICMIAIIYGSSGSNRLFILCFCFFCFGIYNYFAGCLCTTCFCCGCYGCLTIS